MNRKVYLLSHHDLRSYQIIPDGVTKKKWLGTLKTFDEETQDKSENTTGLDKVSESLR